MVKFLSPERSAFFEKSGLPPFWDTYYELDGKKVNYPYMLYACHKEPEQIMQEIQDGSVKAAEIIDQVVNRIYTWDEEELVKWEFSKQDKDFINAPREEIFCMRIGWALKDGHPKLFEINAQGPTIWIEPETAGPMLIKQFGLRNPTPHSDMYLKKALNQAIKKSLAVLPIKRRKDPTIGFVSYNDDEGLMTMRWLADRCVYKTEVFPIEDLDFTIENNIPFNKKTGQLVDGLIYWDALELLEDYAFTDGTTLRDLFIKGFQEKSFALIHVVPAYFAQSKTNLAYITANAKNIFTGKYKDAEKYFSKTYFSPEKLGDSYIAKPIRGRGGQGCFIIRNGKATNSRYLDDYYVNQKKIYQELLTIPHIAVEGEELNWVYESWVYRVDGKFVPGATSLRGCNQEITDDFCYFMPIGV
jgi:glutathionylspermidine synthase